MMHESVLNIPPSIRDLADKNWRQCLRMNEDDSWQKKGAQVLSSRFGRWQKQDCLDKYLQKIDTAQNPLRPLVETLFRDGSVAMLLVRPEMFHHSGAVVDFLIERGFRIRYKSERIVGNESYLQMYRQIFGLRKALPSLPTRTMVYTGSPCMMVLFDDPSKRFGAIPLPDAICENLKGKGGVADKTTIRGSVVYPEAVRLGFDTLLEPRIAAAVDPLAAIRHLSDLSSKNQPHASLSPKDRPLFYNAVSVHIPDSDEIVRDFLALNGPNQIAEVSDALASREQLRATQLHGNEEISIDQFPNIKLFNEMWIERKIRTPLVLYAGGYAGTGKSYVVEQLRKFIPHLSTYPTGFARSNAQLRIPAQRNPALHESTFHLHKLCSDPSDEAEIWQQFLNQREAVEELLICCVSFIAGEHQNTAIDGNHISSEIVTKVRAQRCAVHPVSFCLKVTDPEVHRQMMCGPTHSRELSELDFKTARILHDRIVAENLAAGVPVFEYDKALVGVLKYLDDFLASIVAADEQ